MEPWHTVLVLVVVVALIVALRPPRWLVRRAPWLGHVASAIGGFALALLLFRATRREESEKEKLPPRSEGGVKYSRPAQRRHYETTIERLEDKDETMDEQPTLPLGQGDDPRAVSQWLHDRALDKGAGADDD